MYGNQEKEQWRDSLYKYASYVIEPERRKTEFVITLAGKRFLTRKTATRWGFKNIIGVDLDDDVVRWNNEHGRTVVQASLGDFCCAFNKPVCLIDADLCGGMAHSDIVALLQGWMFNAALGSPFLALTVAVGRERGNTLEWLYDNWEHCRFLHLTRQPDSELAAGRGDDLNAVNRALAAILMHERRAKLMTRMRGIAEEQGVDLDKSGDSAWEPVYRQARDSLGELTTDGLGLALELVYEDTYRAHKTRMDTVIARRPRTLKAIDFNNLFRGNAEFTKIRRHIAAKLAWRTMRAQA